jgi:hypothetical protein
MIFIGEEVLRHARTLAEAEEILRRHRPAPYWTFVLTDLKSREAIAIESSRDHFARRKMEGKIFVQTNHLMHPENRELEFISLGTKMNSLFRMEKAFALAEEPGARANAKAVARILAYQDKASGEMTAYRDILKAHTVQTMLLESRAGEQHLYVSTGEAPTAAGPYHRFSLRELFREDRDPKFEAVDLLRTPASVRQRQKEISRSFRAYFDLHRPLEAAGILREHQTLNALLFRSSAHLEVGEPEMALSLTDQGLRDPHFLGEPAYIRQSLEWVKLAALVRMEREAEAKTLAKELLTAKPANPRLRKFAELVAEGRSAPRHLRRPRFEFFSGDLDGRPY